MTVLDEELTDPDHGWEPRARPIRELLEYGIIPLDKPRGPTSHEVVAWTRKIVGQERAGHSGTLDPAVSGVLPIGLGQATKALGLLLMFPKEYWGIMRVHSSVPRRLLDSTVAEFRGEIFQRPPQRSSVRRDVRTRMIHELELVESEGNLHLFRCLCESGTYIRKLIYDLGEILGVGATMIELRRTKVGPLTEEDGLVTLHQLNDAVYRMNLGDESFVRSLVKPIEAPLGTIKKIIARDSAVDALCHGARLGIPGVLQVADGVMKGDTVCLMSAKGELVALGKALMTTEQITSSKRGLASTTERVIMKPGTYPKLWKKKNAESASNSEADPSSPNRPSRFKPLS
jgi:H/ACA ribonucleoprotein complex subunit 4